MKSTSKLLLVFGIGAALVALFGVSVAHANPLQILPTVQLSAATTTPAFLTTGGNATTTSFDSYANGQPLAVDRGVLLLQMTASSTASVLGVSLQYSNDKIDWYGDDMLTAVTSTTTQAYNISAPISYTWTAAGTAVASKAVLINFPTRYVRAIFTETGAPAAVWWQYVPQRQGK